MSSRNSVRRCVYAELKRTYILRECTLDRTTSYGPNVLLWRNIFDWLYRQNSESYHSQINLTCTRHHPRDGKTLRLATIEQASLCNREKCELIWVTSTHFRVPWISSNVVNFRFVQATHWKRLSQCIIEFIGRNYFSNFLQKTRVVSEA